MSELWDTLKTYLVPLGGVVGGFLAGFVRVQERFLTAEHRLDAVEAKQATSLLAMQTELTSLKAQLNEMREKVEREARASLTSYASAALMAELQKEQEDRWREINRTLGKIEGILEASGP